MRSGGVVQRRVIGSHSRRITWQHFILQASNLVSSVLEMTR